MRKLYVLSTLTAGVLLTACAAKPPIVAQNKTVVVNDQTIIFGGIYDKEKKSCNLLRMAMPLCRANFHQ
ncbi:hypothetical protein ACNH6B_01330 [Shewanella basaltis]|uniref:hypothetical protein n=1 Tax=Shewanella basaltis TaxID=472183 RepID=UPI003AB030C9